MELAVTAVVLIVMVPAVMAPEVPIEALDPVFTRSLLPAVLRTRFPLVAVMAPRVAVKVVVAAMEPGAIKVLGTLKVIVLPEPVVVISFEVPAKVILPAEGEIAPPDPPVRVLRSPAPAPKSVHVADTVPAEDEKDVSM
jgi:hypothetical protein